MGEEDKRLVKVGPRLSKFIGAKATRDKKLQAASMQAEFTLRDTLIMLCYLGRDADQEIAVQARTNLIPAARTWWSREDRPDLPEPIRDIVVKVIERVGPGDKAVAAGARLDLVEGNIGLLGLGEIIQAIDHNNRTVRITLKSNGRSTSVYTDNGKVVGAVCEDLDGIEALYQAFSWADALFTYEHAAPGHYENRIQVNTLNLVFDALEYAPDEDPFHLDIAADWRVHGQLQSMNIFEIAEIFEMNSKQCVCKLEAEGGESGILYFGNGRVANAKMGDMEGLDAACHLLAWPKANFEIFKGGEDIEDVIHVGMQNLIIEAMRLLDEGVTITDRIADELQKINDLFEGADVSTLSVLDRVRLIFGDDEAAREQLEVDGNPVVRKAIKVKISKTVHRYLSPITDHDVRMKAARGQAPMSTTEKLVLLTYLSRDENEEIRGAARKTLEDLDLPTYRKGLGSDLHPAVMDYLVRETIRDESIIKVACSSPAILEETAIHVLDNWKGEDVLQSLVENSKLLERSNEVSRKLAETVSDMPRLKKKLETFETGLLEGMGDIKVEGPLGFFGIAGLLFGAKQGLRSGTIVFEGAGPEIRVFFERGRIIGARSGDETGRPVIERLLKHDDVRFRYVRRTYFAEHNAEHSQLEDLLQDKSAGPTLEPDSATVSYVVGHPDAMDLFEALSSLEGSLVPVRVNIMCEEGSGEVFRDGHRILHAAVDGKDSPAKAMAAMMSWTGTKFLARRAAEGDFETTVDKSLIDFFTESLAELPDEMKSMPRPGELPEWELSESEFESLYFQILNMGVAEKIKLAMTGNKEAREILVRDSNKMVAVAAVKSPKIQLPEVESISKSRNVSEDVLRTISASRNWMKSYTVKLNLVGNSKTPIPIAMKFLPHIRELDLRKLAKSKDVPAAVATQARRLAEMKSGK